MRSLRGPSSACLMVLALLAACFSAAPATAQDSGSWDNLRSLRPGQETCVVMNDVKSYQGEFESLSDEGITLRQAAGEQTLARKDILRVSQKEGRDHQTRDVLIGLAVGAGAGLVIGLSPYFVQRNCTEGPAFSCGNPPNPHLVEGLTPVGSMAGAAVGAAISTRGWHTVYRTR